VPERKNRAETLKRGREALRNSAWNSAYTHLAAADRISRLSGDDLEGLAAAAYLSGRERHGVELLTRAHQVFAEEGAPRRSARCAFWLGFISLNGGEEAQGSGWLSRAARTLEGQPECVERGYLLLPEGILAVRKGDAAAAKTLFTAAVAIGQRFGDKDLVTLALQGQGRALIRCGNFREGLPLIDEAMVAVTAGEVSPIVAGAVYCSVLDSCRETFDMRRASEWTAALSQWCSSQPELVPYRGNCQLHRAEVLQLRGAWSEALSEAQSATGRLSEGSPKPALGAAFYRVAELCRMRGDFAAAERAYEQAAHCGITAQPGFARLRLAQGQTDAALVAIRRFEIEVRKLPVRAEVLAAFVEISIAAKDVVSARRAAEEFAKLASAHGAVLLLANSACAMGSVLLAEGKPHESLAPFRQGWSQWTELDAPYDAARVRVCIGLACRQLGDQDAAALEFSAARKAFESLGAQPDLARVDQLAGSKPSERPGPLTSREVQVLRLVASGTTNRGIAEMLGISEKTVARHLSNIFVKLDLNSRAAATAYAFQNGLVPALPT